MANAGQALAKGQGQGPIIKLGDKAKNRQTITNLEVFNFNFHVLKLLFKCYWLE